MSLDLVIPKRTLLRLVESTIGVADKKSAMPALANLLLEANHADMGTRSSLRVSGTDLYLSASSADDADVATAGSVAVPAKDLLERVKAMPDGPVQIISGEGAQTTLKAVGSPRRYTLHGIPGSEFPQLPKPAPDASLTIHVPATTLAQMIARVAFSISTDETRPNVNSMLFEVMNGTLRTVSTDGHRLTKAEQTIEIDGAPSSMTMLIPLKAVHEIERLLAGLDRVKGSEPHLVTITQSGPNVFLMIGAVLFSAKLIDAQFPPYQQVIPKHDDHTLRGARTSTIEALKAVSLAASDRTGGVKVQLTRNTMRITSESPESGNGFDELTIDYCGPDVTIGFNAKYLIDTLNAVTSDDFTMGVGGELDPAVIRPGSEVDGASFLGVAMPLRI